MTRFVLGTRGSPLALAQARIVAQRIRQVDPSVQVAFEVIQTHGDEDFPADADPPLSGKALFTQRIEDALVEGRIHAAVHSFKDLPAESAAALVVAAVPEREQPFDALVSTAATSLHGLPPASRVGTSSLRRTSQLRAARPDLEILPLRGNVETRLRRWREGGWEAIVIAYAGLRRLGLDSPATHVLPPDLVLPAPAQGALAVQARADDTWTRTLLEKLEAREARVCVEAERSFSHALGGDCNVPVAALARLHGSHLRLEGCIAEPNGTRVVRGHAEGAPEEAQTMGRRLARRLQSEGGDRILEAVR